MATTLTANQTTVLLTDNDGDGVIDPGDTVLTTVTISNTGGEDATNVSFDELLNGMTETGAINASPIAFNDSGYSTAGNVAFNGTSVLGNDVEPLGPEDLGLNTGTAIVGAGTPFASLNGGSVTVNADGTFSYTSAVGFEGTDTFTYTLRDTGLDGTANNADDLTSTGTVSITVGPSVWFIDNNAPGSANLGTQADPFTSIAAFNAAQAAGGPNDPDDGDFIYLRQGTGNYSEADGINLGNNQTLIGQGQNLVVNGVTIETATSAPTIQVTGAGGEGVLLAQNNTLRGFDISSTNAATDGIEDGGGTVGNLAVSDVSISGLGQAIDIDQGGALNVTIDSLTSTGASEEGIQLANVAGSFTATTVSLNGMSGDGVDLDGNSASVAINGGSIGNTNDPGGIGVDVNGGTGNVTVNAIINKTTAGDAIEVTGRSTGTVDFNGNITSTNGGGIDLNTNTGGTVRFDGGMSLSTGATTAFNATGNTGMTLVVTDPGAGSNILTTTTGTALNVANTTIGAEDLTFQSISSNGGSATGIILDTTGSLGGLHVTGTGTAGSGGTIANKTGADGSTSTGIGIYLHNTSDVQLDRMQLNDFQNFAIRGLGVDGFTLANSTVSGTNGTSAAFESYGEGSIYFGKFVNAGNFENGVTGDVFITNSSISGGFNRNFSVVNTSGNLDFDVSGTTFGLTAAASTGDSLSVEARNSSQIDARVTGSTFTGAPGDLAEFVNQVNTGTMNLTFTGNTLSNSHAGNIIGGGGMTIATAGTMVFNISNNSFRDADGSAITMQMAAPLAGDSGVRSLSGTFDNNTIGVTGVAGSGSDTGNGIFLSFADNTTAPKGTATLAITNNVIRNYDGNAGIYADNTGGNYDVNLTVTGNTTAEPGVGAFAGFAMAAGAPASSDDIDIFAKIQNNNFSAGDPANANDIIVGVSGLNSSITLSGAPAGPFASLADVQNFLAAQNNFAGTVVTAYTDIGAGAAGFFGSAGSPPLPGSPTLPLFAAEGGVEAPDGGVDAVGDGGDTLVGGSDADDLVDGEPSADEGGSQEPDPQPAATDDGILSQGELDVLVGAAIERWALTGISAEQVEALEAVAFTVEDMSGLYLGAFEPGQIRIDADAAGLGWFIDGTPLEDSEFANLTDFGALWTGPDGAPAGHMDLLTTLMHEMGHVLGLEDSYLAADRGDLMYGTLVMGERRVPLTGEAAQALLGSITTEEFLAAPVTVGTLPSGQQVVIQWTATIDPQTGQLIVDPVNTGQVTGTNFPSPTDTNTVTTTLDALELGSHVFNDVNENGVFDGGDAGIAGVDLTLYVDDGSGVFDAGDVLVAETQTGAGGAYSFAGLAPGTYIVQVDQSNFDAGGALANVAQGSSPGNPDPDDNTDNDDNGERIAGQGIVSLPITLAYDTETTADGTGQLDINATLDIGVVNLDATAEDDAVTVAENAVLNGAASVFADNGSGPDSDPEGDAFTVTAVTGGAVGVQFALPSGALLTLNADGTFAYDPNGMFDTLPALGSGASNVTAADTFTYTISSGDVATVTVTVTGVDSNDKALGTAGADTIDAGLGNDSVWAGPGGDSVTGGQGNDVLWVDNVNDTVTEAAGEGNDTLYALADATLAAGSEVEVLQVANAAAVNLTGNEFAQRLLGSSASNQLSGAGGNDTLNGGAGADSMAGGAGDDVFWVDNVNDTVGEAAGEGNDTVYAQANATLAAGSEVEYLQAGGGAGAINLSGSDFAQKLIGNGAVNQLIGAGGNDTLNGGAGADSMAGGAGDDVFWVDNANDTVAEAAGQGNDTVYASTSFTLTGGSEVEFVQVSGAGAVNLTGNETGQVLAGNANANQLTGAGGNDFLTGGAGSDTLTGGTGADSLVGGADADRFVYAAVSDSTVALAGRDHILAFSHADGDQVDLQGIDAIAGGADNPFTFVPGGAFTNVAGELIVRSVGASLYLAEGDIGGDAFADFAILLTSITAPDQTDFML